MHEGELALTDDRAARLIAQTFPELAHLPIERVRSTGTVNTIFRIGDDLAARFTLVAESRDVLGAEAAAMAELADVCGVPATRPVGLAAATEEHPSAWSIQTWLAGVAATPTGHASSESLVSDVSGLITVLRSTETRGRKFDGRGRGGVLRDHDEWVALCIERSAHQVDPDRVDRLWSSLRDAPREGADVMSHRDLTPFNLLVADDRLVGVLDGGGFGPADPALDLVAAWHLFDARGRSVVRDRLRVSDSEWRRGAAWALQQAMGLVWYYESSNPAMSGLGRSTMRRLLDDPDLANL